MIKTTISKLQAVAVAASTDETRYYLGGVYLHMEKNVLHGVAVDGHRLFRYSEEQEKGHKIKPFILRRQDIKVLKLMSNLIVVKHGLRRTYKDLADGIDIKYNGKGDAQITFTNYPDFKMNATPIDGSFPDYKKVIPEKGKEFREEIPLNLAYLASINTAAKFIKGNKIRIYTSGGNEAPMIFDVFLEGTGALESIMNGVIMPMKF